MTELSRTTLIRVQQRLEESCWPGAPLRCMLVEHATPEQRPREFPPDSEPYGQTLVHCGGSIYRNVGVMRNPDGTYIFATQPVKDVNGNPIVNTAGEAFAVERGAVRTVLVHGDLRAFESFRQIAIEAGSSVSAGAP